MNIQIINATTYPPSDNIFPYIYSSSKNNQSLSLQSWPTFLQNVYNGNLFLATNNSLKVVGWIQRIPLWNNWYALSTLWVLPEYRGNKIGLNRLLPTIIEASPSYHLYAATDNASIQQLLISQDFRVSTITKLPSSVLVPLLITKYASVEGAKKLFNWRTRSFRYFIKV